MRRFFVPPENIGSKTIEITDRGDIHHMKKVLRMKPGDEVDISDTQRFEYRAVLEDIDEDRALFAILDKQSFATEPETKVTLFQGIPKQGKMENIIQKCVELGIEEIVPVFTKRTVVVDRGKMDKKIDRWQKVSAEAVKQCRRGVVPTVRKSCDMAQVIDELDSFGLVMIPYENEEGTTIRQILTEHKDAGNIALIIGPEGGFSEEEVAAVTEAGGHSVSLGKTTLRTETAGPAALAMIMYEMEL